MFAGFLATRTAVLCYHAVLFFSSVFDRKRIREMPMKRRAYDVMNNYDVGPDTQDILLLTFIANYCPGEI